MGICMGLLVKAGGQHITTNDIISVVLINIASSIVDGALASHCALVVVCGLACGVFAVVCGAIVCGVFAVSVMVHTAKSSNGSTPSNTDARKALTSP